MDKERKDQVTDAEKDETGRRLRLHLEHQTPPSAVTIKQYQDDDGDGGGEQRHVCLCRRLRLLLRLRLGRRDSKEDKAKAPKERKKGEAKTVRSQIR